jgi:hypothetical protein
MKIEIHSGPDSLGRYLYTKRWEVENHPYCLTCGASPDSNCSCFNTRRDRAQVFHGQPPKGDLDGKQ